MPTLNYTGSSRAYCPEARQLQQDQKVVNTELGLRHLLKQVILAFPREKAHLTSISTHLKGGPATVTSDLFPSLRSG